MVTIEISRNREEKTVTINRLDHLDTFVKVAELKGFSRTAEHMNVSKAHVSRQINRLEERLGVQLLRRSTRNVVLTELGEAFYLRIRDNLNALDEAEQAVMDMQESPRGTLRITVAGAFGENYVAPCAAEFMQDYVDLNIELNFTDRTVDLITEGYDLAIRSGVLQDSSLIARRITSRKLFVCASPEYIQLNGKPENLSDLKKHDCLIGSQPTWHFKDARGKHTQTRIEGKWACNNGYALLQAALRGIGITQLPEYYVRSSLDEGKLVSCLEKFQPSDNGIWAVYPSNRHLSPKVRLFVDLLVERYSEQWS